MNEFHLPLGLPARCWDAVERMVGSLVPRECASLAEQAQTEKQLQFSVLVLAFTIEQLENQMLRTWGF